MHGTFIVTNKEICLVRIVLSRGHQTCACGHHVAREGNMRCLPVLKYSQNLQRLGRLKLPNVWDIISKYSLIVQPVSRKQHIDLKSNESREYGFEKQRSLADPYKSYFCLLVQ